jgi:hypothetical protein
MIVPEFWAEARVQHRDRERQVTIRRFGWSDTSQDDAQANAKTRAEDALRRTLAGEKLDRREPRRAYNGASGVPIREEIVSRHGGSIVTRNSYGARCLNTPNILFADIDHPAKASRLIVFIFFITPLIVAMGAWITNAISLWKILFPGLPLFYVAALFFASGLQALHVYFKGGHEQLAISRLARFVTNQPSWSIRIYRTSAGIRLLVTHQTFSPSDPEVDAFFKATSTDPIFARMCLKQQCFRARVSPKPWRIGIAEHMKPRPGVWPVHPERLQQRNAWIDNYEAKATGYAACRYIETIGSGIVHRDVAPIVELHDSLCQANRSQLPLA